MDSLVNFKEYLHNIKRSMLLKDYYVKKIKDGKSMKASFLDTAFAAMFITITFLVLVFNFTKHFIFSIILTILFIALYLFLLLLWKNKSRYKKISLINEDIGNKEIIKEITKFGSHDYMLYIKDVLEKYYATTFFEYDSHIDFIGEINEEIYGVKCFKNSLENRLTLKDVESFLDEMKKMDIQEGIIVTNSYFAEEVKEQINFILIDFDQFKEILKKIGLFPSRDEIEKIIVTKYRNKKGKMKGNLSFHRKDKIYKFILLGIVLYTVSYFVSYPLYYKVIGALTFTFGIIIGVYNIVKHFEKNQELKI